MFDYAYKNSAFASYFVELRCHLHYAAYKIASVAGKNL